MYYFPAAGAGTQNLGTLTIVNGILTIPPGTYATSVTCFVTGENGASDTLDNIVGALPGQIITLRGSDDLDTITLPGDTGGAGPGFRFSTGTSFGLSLGSSITLIFNQGAPLGNGWSEVSRINQPL